MFAMNTMTWTIAVVLLAVLAYLGYAEMSRRGGGASGGGSVAARRASNSRAPTGGEPLAGLDLHHYKNPASVDKAFRKVEVDPSMQRIVGQDSSNIDTDEWFMQHFHNADDSAFRPVNREQARESANVRPAQMAQNGRADGHPPARFVGVNTMMHARPMIQRPAGDASCIAFNDTDHRSSQAAQA